MEEMFFLGHYHFEAKDKSRIYYVIQCLHSNIDIQKSIKKGTMINIFVSDDVYKHVINNYDIGSLIKVKINPNYETGKINYSLVL